jgi:hypothetical protein
MHDETPSQDSAQEIRVQLPETVHQRLCARVEKLDTTIQEWVTTVVIEALDRPEGLSLAKET